MIAAIIGISSGLLIILLFGFLKKFDKKIIYNLILTLTGIGFLYVGFVWTDLRSLIINSIQASLFLILAYFGIQKNSILLPIGYFLHGAPGYGIPFISTYRYDATVLRPVLFIH